MGIKARPEIDRFREKYAVDAETGCWNWLGSRVGRTKDSPADRGMFYLGPGHEKTRMLAYRWSYEHFVGPIPEGLQIDHLCRNPSCVNPDHLEPVTARENVRRGTSHIAKLMDSTHCPRGHELAGENLYVGVDGGRRCKTCRLDRTREYEDRNRDRRRAADSARRRVKRAADRERARGLLGPDCREGKHRACDDRAWDDEADAAVLCGCACHAGATSAV